MNCNFGMIFHDLEIHLIFVRSTYSIPCMLELCMQFLHQSNAKIDLIVSIHSILKVKMHFPQN